MSINIDGRPISITRGVVKLGRLEHEWYEDLADPQALIDQLATTRNKPDVFTFWQRLPDTVPRYSYHMEWDDIAVLPVKSYDDWWSNQIKSRTRGIIRKTAKMGVDIRETEYTDDFVRGMVSIFNESPMRQGRPFWHYGKDFETVKHQFARYLFREKLIGAYFQSELIGFLMLGFAGHYAVTGQIISKISHRDKGTNNALIAKAVEICGRENIPNLVYVRWDGGSLTEFKRRNGFEPVRLPRYYVPLTAKGRIALALGCHTGVSSLIPESLLVRLKRLRTSGYRTLYSLRYRHAALSDADA